MSWRERLRRLLRDTRRGRALGADIDEELQFHLEEIVRELRHAGISEGAARRQALARFGRLEAVRDEARRAKGIGLAEDLVHDARFGFRTFIRQPGFTAVVVLTLALGIGANTAIFTLVNAVLLEPLPYGEPDRLAFLFLDKPELGKGSMGEADFVAVARRQRTFEAVAALTSPPQGFTFAGGGTPEQVQGTAVTAGFFSVLGIRPILGRTFEPGEDAPGRQPTAVVADGFFRDRLQSDPSAIGRAITLSGRSYTVIGVMPSGFHFGARDSDQLWPILQLEEPTQREPYYLTVIGRLKPGESWSRADADVARIATEVWREFPTSDPYGAQAVPMKEVLVQGARTGLLVLLGAVALLLLIAVVNVASLQLARGATRRQEIALRAALGAGWFRLVRQLATEGLVLASAGGALGLVLAWSAIRAVVAARPDFLPRAGTIAVNGRVLAFTCAIVLASAVVCGIAPALRARVLALDTTLKQRRPRQGRLRAGRLSFAGLVVVQVALALVLLVGAGLLARSLVRLQNVDAGCNPAHVLTMRISLHESRYQEAGDVTSLYSRLLERVASQPGVRGAALSMSLPPDLLRVTNPFHLEGESYEPGKSTHLAEEVPISPDYFRVLGIPLVAGRVFDDGDRTSGRPVLVINEAMARRYFSGNAVGRRIQTGNARPDSTWETIVGVVGNVKYQGLGEGDQPTIYVPYHAEGWNPWFVRTMFLVVRTEPAPETLAPAVRAAVWSLDREAAVSDVRPMQDRFARSVSTPRFRTLVLVGFAALALVLAALGLYGTLAYSVATRTHDIGVRMAIGATGGSVVRDVLTQGVVLTGAGVALGTAAALGATRLMSALLFDIAPTDPATFAGAAVALVLVGACAAGVPARRAARVDPIVALKTE